MRIFRRERRGGSGSIGKTICLLICICFRGASRAPGQTLHIDINNTTGPWLGTPTHPYAVIQNAIDAASNGDSLIITEGIYRENMVVVQKDLALTGTDPENPETVAQTVVDGGHADSVFQLNEAKIHIEGLTIRNGTAPQGGGIDCADGRLSLSKAVIIGNLTCDGIDGAPEEPGGAAGSGAGLYAFNSKLEITDCCFRWNITGSGGQGGRGDPYVGGDGGPSGSGGAIYALSSDIIITNCNFDQNATGTGGTGGNASGTAGRGGHSGDGGAIVAQDSDLVIKQCRFTGNAAGPGGDAGQGDITTGGNSGDGGAVYCRGATLTIEQCELNANGTGDGGNASGGAGNLAGDSGNGGGIYCRDTQIVAFTDCRIMDNRIGAGGSAAWPGGSGGFTGNGGGACIYGTVPVRIGQCRFSQNEIAAAGTGEFGADGGFGGGLYCSSTAAVSLVDCQFQDNRAGNAGYGVSYGGLGGHGGGAALICPDAEAAACIFTGNTAGDGEEYFYGGDGGGLCCSGNLRAANCLLADNCAGAGDWTFTFGYGGGIYTGSSLVMTNCTVAGNTAPEGQFPEQNGKGGGIFCAASADIANSVFWNNYANGVNDQTAQMDGHITSVRYTCVQNWAGDLQGEGNFGEDPLFADRINGDYHLRSQAGRWDSNSRSWTRDPVSSPGIDAGDPAEPNWMNETWPHGKRINLGAYGGTVHAGKSLSTVGHFADLNHDNCIDQEDLRMFAATWRMPQQPCPQDFDQDGRVTYGDFALFAQDWNCCPGLGLVGHWEFNEPAGEVAYDTSVCANPGTLMNRPVRTGTGAVRFDGQDDYIQVPDSACYTFADQVSLCVRLCLLEDSDRFMKILVKPSSSQVEDPWENFGLDLRRKNPRFILSAGLPGTWNGVYDAAWNSPIPAGAWVHVAGTYDGTTMRLYVNGQETQSRPVSLLIGYNRMPLWIGGRQSDDGFGGIIDDIRLYNRALEASEILYLSRNP